MKSPQGDKYIWVTKVSSKGQIVIPKEAREVFDIKDGDSLIMFGDKEKGIALAKYNDYLKFAEAIFAANNGDKKWLKFQVWQNNLKILLL